MVGTSDSSLLLGEVQLEGKRRMSAGEFLRGHPDIAAFRAQGDQLPKWRISFGKAQRVGA